MIIKLFGKKINIFEVSVVFLLIFILVTCSYFLYKADRIINKIRYDVKEIKSYIRHMDDQFSADQTMVYSAYSKFVHTDDLLDKVLGVFDS